jgi:hypothetical protein
MEGCDHAFAFSMGYFQLGATFGSNPLGTSLGVAHPPTNPQHEHSSHCRAHDADGEYERLHEINFPRRGAK